MTDRIILLFLSLISYSCLSEKEQSKISTFKEHKELFAVQYPNIEPSFDVLVDYIDSILIVVSCETGNAVSLYNRNDFSPITSGVSIGNGPNEILYPFDLRVDEENRVFGVYDAPKKELLLFSLDSIMFSSKFIVQKRIKSSNSGEFRYPIIPISDSLNISMTWTQDAHFQITDLNGRLIKSYGVFKEDPRLSNCPEFMVGAFWEGRYDLNSKTNKIVKAYLYHDKISIYNLDDGEEINAIYTSSNKYQNVIYDGSSLKVKDRRACYTSLHVSNNYIYALYHGGPLENSPDVLGREIHVFDLSGNPIKKLILNPASTDISIDEEQGFIYGVNYAMDRPLLVYQL